MPKPHRVVIPKRDHLEASLAQGSAIVLERIARGGGATNWYRCADVGALDEVAQALRHGSLVSFYFDDRLVCDGFVPETRERVLRIAARAGECVVAAPREGSARLAVDFISTESELDEFFDEHSAGDVLYYGAYPGRDNDGVSALTFTMPDADGVIRTHPY